MMSRVPLVVTLLLAAAACVPQKQYDKLVKESAEAATKAEEQHKTDEAELARLKDAVAKAEAASQEEDNKLSELSTSKSNLQASLDEATAINQRLEDALARAGKDADKILKEKGTLAKALDDAKARLEELRKAQAAAQERVQLFADLAQRFKPLIDVGQVRIDTRHGKTVLAIPSDVLFDPGRSEIKSSGRGVVMELAKALSAVQGKRFQVSGHTDAQGERDKRRARSWELSSARAVEIVKLMTSLGVRGDALSAAGFGEFDPVATNDTPEGRAKNRRVEITLLDEDPQAQAAH